MVISLAIMGLAAVANAGAEPLTGSWGTFGARLTLTSEGGVLQQECASTAFGPVSLDRHGRFQARGKLDAGSGPQHADAAPKLQPVRLSGTVSGDTLNLELDRAGSPPLMLSLQRNSRAKVIRCM